MPVLMALSLAITELGFHLEKKSSSIPNRKKIPILVRNRINSVGAYIFTRVGVVYRNPTF